MKLRNGFVSNSSSSSFILNTETNRHYGDNAGHLRLCWGYFRTYKECKMIFDEKEWDHIGPELFYKAGLQYTTSESESGCFFGVPEKDYADAESAKAATEAALKATFEKLPHRFLVGEIES